MSDIIIRKMSPGDIDSVLLLQSDSHLSAWTKSGYINELDRDDSILYVAAVDSAIVGFVAARLITSNVRVHRIEAKGEGEILNIAVAKKMRGEGIGTKLLRAVFATAIRKNIGEIWLEVRESNVAAQNFYRANGFSVSGKRKTFYRSPTEDAVLMRAEIT
jgi:ribosomal-protein-alanine acetyltransferase